MVLIANNSLLAVKGTPARQMRALAFAAELGCKATSARHEQR